jgi:hypothetical protein
MIHDQCDYCFREFGREPGQKAICPNCGLENVRPAVSSPPQRESAMLAGAPERAVKPQPKPRKKRIEKRIRK